MGHFTRCQLITKDKLNLIPVEIIHFFNNDYIHFPIKMSCGMDDVRNEFGQYETTDDLIQNKSNLSIQTFEIIEIIEKLGINSFLIEFLEDVGDWFPPLEFIQFVVMNKKILKESIASNVDENGDAYCESILGYDDNYNDAPFTSYENAIREYQKNIGE